MASAEKIRIYDKGVDYRTDYETYGEYLNLRFGDIVIPNVPSSEPLKEECQHFLNCVRDRSTPRSDGQDGLRVLKIIDAAQRVVDRIELLALSNLVASALRGRSLSSSVSRTWTCAISPRFLEKLKNLRSVPLWAHRRT